MGVVFKIVKIIGILLLIFGIGNIVVVIFEKPEQFLFALIINTPIFLVPGTILSCIGHKMLEKK